MWSQWTEERLNQPYEQLALNLLSELILRAAAKFDIPVANVTEEMAKAVLLAIAAVDSDSVATASLEKVLRRAVRGDLAGAGRLFREWMLEGAKMNRLVTIGADRKRQVKGFSEEGVRARRRYSETDKNDWRTDAAQLPGNLSKIAKATRIAKRRDLPKEAIHTIRKEI